MNEVQDSMLRTGLAGFASGRDDGDWRDVMRRAKTAHRRRIFGGVGVAAIVLVGVASAFALTRPSVDFLSAKKSPHSVVVDFGREQVMAPPEMAPGVIPNEARRIIDAKIDGKTHTLYIAPTKAGGFCYQWLGSSCEATRSGPLAKRISGGAFGGPHGITVLDGTFLLAKGARLEVTYADGAKSDIPFVWVTKPINAGFYLYRIPDAHRRAGHQVVSVALFDDRDHLLTSERLPSGNGIPSVNHSAPGFPHLGVPPGAIYADRQQLFDIRADNGSRQGLWIAPENGGGTCYWTNRGAGCDQGHALTPGPRFFKAHPELRGAQAVLGLGFEGGNPVDMCCTVSSTVARVDLRFQDGDLIELTPKKTFLLVVIPSRHYALGHRLREIVAYNTAGTPVAKRAVGDMPGVYPCSKADEKNLGYGVTRCP